LRAALVDVGDPVVPVAVWFPEFHRLHRAVVVESGDFDYAEARKHQPEAYAALKEIEAHIDALGDAPVSLIVEIMSEWRGLVSACLKQKGGLTRVKSRKAPSP
jgi:hypothetical protein